MKRKKRKLCLFLIFYSNSYHQQQDFEGWGSWASMQAQKTIADQYREMMIQQAAAAKAAQEQSVDSETALDFFQDMAPSLRKSKKVRCLLQNLAYFFISVQEYSFYFDNPICFTFFSN